MSIDNFTMSPLGEKIRMTKKTMGMPLDDLTVLSADIDPYRLDTKANHARAQWLADEYNKLSLAVGIRLRGLHYALVGTAILPDGPPFVNDGDTWLWMSQCAKAVDLLGYILWAAVRDNRNTPPTIFTPEMMTPRWSLSVRMRLPTGKKQQESQSGGVA